MKIEFIRLENFRQFRGTQEVELSTLDDLNVTVFHGVNGAGKTSLFRAINWCLYGAGTEDIGELTNRAALANVADGATVKTCVTIVFRQGSARYLAKRLLQTKKLGDKTRAVGSPEFSLIRMSASGDSVEEPNPSLLMNAILPETVRSYFFFDGEKMDDLTRADNKEVAEAVRNVMRLPALERAQGHLEDIAAEFRRDIKKQGSPELEKLIAREEELRAEKDTCTQRRDELKDEIRLARQRVEDLEARLREKEGAKALQHDRDRAQNEHEALERQLETRTARIQQVANRAYVNLLDNAALQALQVLDEKRRRGEIPSGIREQFVKDLLEKQECVCGRPFHAHDEVFERLESLLKRTTSSQLENEVLALAAGLRALSRIAVAQNTELGQLTQDRAEIEMRKERLDKELDEIKHQLAKMPEEDIAGLERNRTRFQRAMETAIADHRSMEDRIKRIETEIEEAKRRKREAEAKERKLKELSRKERIAQDAADAVARIKEEFFEYTRREIEAATKQVFSQLAWKQDHFQDVNLDQDFRLEVIDRWGMPTRKELSAGERQILSLAFICAMSKVAGEDAPLVMDTPFGRLSGNHLSAVAEHLPNLTSQLILFVTDREWDEASRTNLEPRAGAQYELKFDTTTGCTDIVEVAW